MSKIEAPVDGRVETGTFAFKAKSFNGYRLDMTGKVFGRKHGSVIVAALDSQFADDVDLLSAAPELMEVVKAFIAEITDYAIINKLGDPEKQHNIKWARQVIAKAEGQS